MTTDPETETPEEEEARKSASYEKSIKSSVATYSEDAMREYGIY